ncbi:hypothetical protein ACMFLR_10870 [Delftia tsuruhatensis]|uniref:hypothetical protein n=2 Tax=Delftia tsuruhatensis TaxID=180282 RepID=UPI0039BC31AE
MAIPNSTELQALQPWASVIAASIAAVVAIIFGLMQVAIAWRQAKTATNKLRLDMFDRRLAVYRGATDAIKTAIRLQDFPSDYDPSFLDGIYGARWILSPEIASYLQDELWKTLLDLHSVSSAVGYAKDSAEHAALLDAKSRKLKEVHSLTKELDRRFAPFLNMNNL